MNNIIHRYEQHCKTYALEVKEHAKIEDDGTFTKLLDKNGFLIFIGKNPISNKFEPVKVGCIR